MTVDVRFGESMAELGMFWWTFAVRGGAAVLFSALLFFVGDLLGTIFFDPILLVMLAVMLGAYILGNGVLLGVASGYAAEHQVGIWRLLLAECIFATALGTYIGFTLLLSSKSLAWLAGLHALGTGCFLLVLAIRLRANKRYGRTLIIAATLSIGAGLVFVSHQYAGTRSATHWLGAFEFLYGVVMLVFAAGLRQHHVPVPPNTGFVRRTTR